MDGRVLLLDVMGTLVTEPFFEKVPEFFGMSIEQLLAEKHPTSWVQFERGLIDEAEYLRLFFADERPVDGPGLKRVLFDAYAWIPGMQELVAELDEAGVPMHTLSNYPSWWELIEEKIALSTYVPWTFVSCKMGLRKPRPEAFLVPANTLRVAPEQCVFVDDRSSNCEGARQVGMTALQFENADALRASLVREGFLKGNA